MREIVEFHGLLNIKRSNNRVSIRSKSIQSEFANNIQSELDNNFYSSFAELNVVVKAT